MRTSLSSRAVFSTITLVTALALAGVATAVTVELAPLKDNTLYETPVGNSNGAGDGIYSGRVGTFGGQTRRRGLVAFDLSSIPTNATVSAASLELTIAQTSDPFERTMTAHRVSANWGEGTSLGTGSGNLATPGDATWTFRFVDVSSWATPGGDFAVAPSGSQLVGTFGTAAWSDAGILSDVQAWVSNPATNFGWLIRGEEALGNTTRKFYSREGLVAPKLIVTYTSTSGVGEGAGAQSVQFAPPYPSPARGPVNLSYTLPRSSQVSLVIHDAMGRTVRRLITGSTENAGQHGTTWDGRTDAGDQAGPGLYLASLMVDQQRYERRIPLLQ